MQTKHTEIQKILIFIARCKHKLPGFYRILTLEEGFKQVHLLSSLNFALFFHSLTFLASLLHFLNWLHTVWFAVFSHWLCLSFQIDIFQVLGWHLFDINLKVWKNPTNLNMNVWESLMGGVDLILLAAGKCSLLCTFSLHFLSHWSHPELFLSLCPCVQLHVNIRTITIVTYIITIPKLGSSVKYR